MFVLNEDEKTVTFPLKWGMKQGCLFSPLLLSVLEFLVRTIRKENKIKGLQVEKAEVK
jgi:hypothetical protein